MLHCLRCFLHHFYVLEGKALKVSLFVQEEDNQTMNDDDAELMKRLRKQNRRAIASVRGGRKTVASRNSYKDKGGKSSHNSKMQKQLSGWWNFAKNHHAIQGIEANQLNRLWPMICKLDKEVYSCNPVCLSNKHGGWQEENELDGMALWVS